MNGLAKTNLFLQNNSDEDFELMGDIPKEDPSIIERRRMRNDEITKKLGAYLLKGYCMLSDACAECDCILLRTPERQLLCVGCVEVDVEQGVQNKKSLKPVEEKLQQITLTNQKKIRTKKSKKRNKNLSSTSENSLSNEEINYSSQLESKLKWAVNELAKSQNPNRINAMCTVIIKLTESIKALKEHEIESN